MTDSWPSILWAIRHGESAANAAAAIAEKSHENRYRFDQRDADVPLSPTGEGQADALGAWFGAGHAHALPDVILASPYLRARQTAQRIVQGCGAEKPIPIIIDERLREKELGILDGLTPDGIAALYPDHAAQKNLLGKFYYRAPGGENWCDVIQRVRAILDRISLHYPNKRVMIVAHEVVIFSLRYVLENMDEAQIMAINKAAHIANCAVNEYRWEANSDSDGGLILHRYNETEALQNASATITDAKTVIAAARG